MRDGAGTVATARRYPRLLRLAGSLDVEGFPLLDGRSWSHATSLAVVRSVVGADATIEPFVAPDRGQRFDVLPLTVLSDGMAEAVGHDYRRFRPDLYVSGVDGLTERDWAGRRYGSERS